MLPGMKEFTNTAAKERPDVIIERAADGADCAQGQCCVEHEAVHAQDTLHGCASLPMLGRKYGYLQDLICWCCCCHEWPCAILGFNEHNTPATTALCWFGA